MTSNAFCTEHVHLDLLSVLTIIAKYFHFSHSLRGLQLLLREIFMHLYRWFLAVWTLLATSCHVLEAVPMDKVTALLSHDHTLQFWVYLHFTVAAVMNDFVFVQVKLIIRHTYFTMVTVKEVLSASSITCSAIIAVISL